MTKPLKRIAITGAGGQIAYSLIFRIAAGDLLGKDQPVALHLLEIPEAEAFLKGLVMELEDCVFPLLKEVRTGHDPNQIFEGVDYALLVGAKPRGPGMERKDLLAENGKIFIGQGKALNSHAAKGVKVFVVGNPCNTNCLIAMHHAPNLSKNQFYAMMRLDQNRAQYQLAKKAGVVLEDVTNIVVWGNHSATQVPDFVNAKICGKEVSHFISDRNWLENQFVPMIQKRGAEVIAARGKSSAASAAHAIIGSIRSLEGLNGEQEVFSIAQFAEKNPYQINEELFFSFPTRLNAHKKTEIISGFHIDSYLEKKLKETEKELLQERDLIAHLL